MAPSKIRRKLRQRSSRVTAAATEGNPCAIVDPLVGDIWVNHCTSGSISHLETVPVEIFNHILSYLIHPTSSLPGLTENQSKHDFPKTEQGDIRGRSDMTKPSDTGRVFEDLFAWIKHRHPFNTLAASSQRCRELVESYCAHLMKACNRFNLPFAHLAAHGQACVYPSMSRIVYRRMWLQTAPRICVFCAAALSNYPHPPVYRLLLTCEDCFYAQTLSLEEIQKYFHLPGPSILSTNHVRGCPKYEWVLRIDVEALALKLYGTRAFHHTVRCLGVEERPCGICRRAGSANNCGESAPRRRRKLPEHIMRSPRSQRQ